MSAALDGDVDSAESAASEAPLPLNFGEHPDVVFRHAPLVRVLCQVKFPPVLSLLTPVGVTGFQTAVRDHYPTMLPPEQTANIAVENETIGIKSNAPVWRMVNDSQDWTVGLAADFVSLETPSYTKIDEFLARLELILSALRRTVRPADSVRIGLRKVNLIAADEYQNDSRNLSNLIRGELLGPLGVANFPAPIMQSFSFFQFTDDDNYLAVRYGFAKVESTDGFVLDTDYFTARPYRIDRDSIAEVLQYFSDGMTSFFHWALTDEFKRRLEPSPRNTET